MSRLKTKRIKTFLWFDGQAEEAARFYTAIFPAGRLGTTTPYPEGGPGPAGSVMTVESSRWPAAGSRTASAFPGR